MIKKFRVIEFDKKQTEYTIITLIYVFGIKFWHCEETYPLPPILDEKTQQVLGFKFAEPKKKSNGRNKKS